MRDLVLSALVAAALLMVFKHPVIGAYLWAWLSLMNPHKMTYGFARALPFAQMAAIATLLALVFTKKRQPLPRNGIAKLQIALLLWMTFTSFFALAPEDQVLARWVFVLKIQFMLFVTWMLVRDAKEIRWLVWVVVLSVAYFGVKGGIFTIMTGGGSRVWGPPGGMLEENNALAVALVMLLPLMYFLRETETRSWVRHALTFMMITCAFSVLGSQSRGALLALVAMAFFLGLKSKYPVRASVVLLCIVGLAIAFMPDTWSTRMETIKTYGDDGSAMSRIWTWTTLWNVAVDRPFYGAGFGADHPIIFDRYAPTEGVFEQFAGRVYVAHSIYFQMLGEHGFIGLGLFLALLATTWFTARRVARRAAQDTEFDAWMPSLMRMVQVSMIGYLVGGAFLSLAYLDLPYYIFALVVLCEVLLRKKSTAAQGSGQGPMSLGLPMLARGAGWVRGAGDLVSSTRLSILIFHRVLPAPDPMFPDLLDAARFEALARLLAASFKVLPVGEAAVRLAAGTLPPGALSITFDDGYADNAEVALPILQRHGLRGTFFVATGFLDGGRMFNDSVIECVRGAGADAVDLRDFELGHRRLVRPADRRRVVDELLPKVKYLGLAEREAFIARLAGSLAIRKLPDDLMMRSSQVIELHRAGMEIGGHTVRHPILRVIDDREAEAEVSDGRARLQELIDAPVQVFAYPNGRPMQDYDGRHVAMVRRLGFRAAVSTAPGTATAASDPHQLPRFSPWDRGAARWMGRLLRMRFFGAAGVERA
jgi:probable O-glycosylation ligase (exosortase A-associated)